MPSSQQILFESQAYLDGYSVNDVEEVRVPLPLGYRYVGVVQDRSESVEIQQMILQTLQENISNGVGDVQSFDEDGRTVNVVIFTVKVTGTYNTGLFHTFLLEKGDSPQFRLANTITKTK